MKLADCTILIQPGFGNSEPDHWQSRWEAKLSTARRVDGDHWERAEKALWVPRLVEAVERETRPVIVVAHSIGVVTLAHAAPQLAGKVAGAFLVGLSDWNRPNLLPGVAHDFAPIPREPFPFPSALVASRNDPYCDYEVAADFANAWGAALIDAGLSGHINTASGHGPWPEGLMSFGGFINKLRAGD